MQKHSEENEQKHHFGFGVNANSALKWSGKYLTTVDDEPKMCVITRKYEKLSSALVTI